MSSAPLAVVKIAFFAKKRKSDFTKKNDFNEFKRNFLAPAPTQKRVEPAIFGIRRVLVLRNR